MNWKALRESRNFLPNPGDAKIGFAQREGEVPTELFTTFYRAAQQELRPGMVKVF